MKIPAKVQIIDDTVSLVIETRAISGTVKLSLGFVTITKENCALIPEIGPVEDGQMMELHLTREGGELH